MEIKREIDGNHWQVVEDKVPNNLRVLVNGSCVLSEEFGEPRISSAGCWTLAWIETAASLLREAMDARAAEKVEEGPKCHGLDTPERVCFYEHDFYPLSNFSAFTLRWKGLLFGTSEAAYHWEKFVGYPTIQEAILNAPSAHEAFKLAEQYKALCRPDWKQVRVPTMRDLLRAKAEQHEYVRRKLLATDDRELVEDSWRDNFWGWGPNKDGNNQLGKLWMEIRDELAARQSPAEPVEKAGRLPEPRFECHYSGESSHEFWEIITTLPNNEKRIAYDWGVRLQNVEEAALRHINEQVAAYRARGRE